MDKKDSNGPKIVKKYEELSLITIHDLFNTIHREVPQQFKSNFIIYEFFQSEMKYKNLIRIPNYPNIQELIESGNFTLKQIQDLLDSEISEMFARRRRLFNIIIPFKNNGQFLGLMQEKYSKTDLPLSIIEFENFVKEIIDENKDLEVDSEYLKLQQALKLVKQMKQEKITEVLILIESFEDLLLKYPFMMEYLEQYSEKFTFPNEIIPGQMYLEEYQYMQNKIKDLDDSEIGDFFKQSFQFIEEALGLDENQLSNLIPTNQKGNKLLSLSSSKSIDPEKSNGRILIHCAQGKSRSATIVLMYLMKKFHWTFDQAYKFVKQKRDYIEPNFGFQEKLKIFEECKNDFNCFAEKSKK